MKCSFRSTLARSSGVLALASCAAEALTVLRSAQIACHVDRAPPTSHPGALQCPNCRVTAWAFAAAHAHSKADALGKER